MDQHLTIPRWNPDFDLSQLDLSGWMAQATAMQRSLGRLLSEAGWPIVKLLPRNWSLPMEQNGQPFKYVVKNASLLEGESDEGQPDLGLLWLTASSDAVDLEGDVIGLPLLKKIKAASVGQTVFLGHRYRVPKDVAGIVEQARLVRKEIFHPLLNKSATFNCVELGVRPIPKRQNKGGYRACQMALEGTARIGASVTVLSTAQDTSKKPMTIHTDGISLETSLVGLPANMTCWAQPNPSPTKNKSFVAVPALPVQTAASGLGVGESDNSSAPGAPLSKGTASQLPMEQVMADATQAPENTAAPAIPETPAAPATETAVTPTPVAGFLTKYLQLAKGYFATEYARRTSNMYFLTSVLADAVDEIRWRCCSPYTSNPMTGEEGVTELRTALMEFTDKVMEALTPQLTGTDATVSKSAEAALADPSARIDLNEFLTPVPLVKALLSKAGKRNSASDATLIQGIHDTCVELEAKCAAQKSAETALVNGATVAAEQAETLQKAHAVELATTKQTLAAAVELAKQLEAELAAARNETARWKAASLVAREALEAYELQPLMPEA